MNSAAFLVGSGDGPPSASRDMANYAGFAVTRTFTNLADVEQQTNRTPICFFLFEQVPDITMLADIVRPIRRCKRQDVRFSPLIYLCDTPSREVIRGCISMGFDDIIARPFECSRVNERLAKQVGRPVNYYETEKSFGPYRRTDSRGYFPTKTDINGGQHRQLKFVRNLITGISILSTRIENRGPAKTGINATPDSSLLAS